MFGVPLLAFYCTFGDILSNLIWCGMMIWLSLLRHPGAGICKHPDRRGAESAVFPHRGAVLCRFGISALDGGLLLAGTSPASPAFWCDMLLTFALLGLLPAVRKAVDA